MVTVKKAANGVYGGVGASLAGSDYGARGAVGAYGEKKTAQIIDSYADRCAIIHDVIVPGLSANLDHVVVSGRRVLIIDTKAWRDGMYHSRKKSGVHRGKEYLDYANTKSLMNMERMMYKHLGGSRRRLSSVLVVWPSPKATQVLIGSGMTNRAIPIRPAYQLDWIMRKHIGFSRGANIHLVRRLNKLRYKGS